MTYALKFTGQRRRNFVSAYLTRYRCRNIAIIWAFALLITSLQPKRPPHFHFSLAHQVAHFLGFGSLAFLATVGFGNPVRTSLWPAVACFLFGFAIELSQHLQNRKPIEWYDVRDDAVGILAFVIFCHIMCRRTVYEKRLS